MSFRNNVKLRNNSPNTDEDSITNATYSKILTFTKNKAKLQTRQPEMLLKICHDLRRKLDREKRDALEVLNSESAAAHSALQEVITVLSKKSKDVQEFNLLCSEVESNPSYKIGPIMDKAQELVISNEVEQEVKDLLSGQFINITTKLQDKADKLLNIKKKLEDPEPCEKKPTPLNRQKSIDEDTDEDDFWPMENRENPLPCKNPYVIRRDRVNNTCSAISIKSEPAIVKIKQRMIPKQYYIFVDVISIIDFKEFYVRDRYHLKKQEDDAFLFSLQMHYAKPHNINKMTHPKVNDVAAVKVGGIWHRCRIISLENVAIVSLIDAGRYESIKLENLMVLDPSFYECSEIAMKCSMADIAPIESFEFPARAYDEFRMFAFNSQYGCKILTTDDVPENSGLAVPCILYICGIQDKKKIRFNSFMVKFQYAASTGKESECPELEQDSEAEDDAKAIAQMRNEEKEMMKMMSEDFHMDLPPVTRVTVKILNVVSPGEFYITTVCREDEILDFHKMIQFKFKPASVEHDNDHVWKINEKCLVYHELNPARHEWFRAMVVEKLTDVTYTLFLIDFGIKITSYAHHMSTMPQQFKTLPAGAIKAHLFGISHPLNTNDLWPQSTLDLFQTLIKKFMMHCVSVFLRNNVEDDSLPVLLWGVVKKNLLTTVYHNLPQYMFYEGFVDSKVKPGYAENLVNPYDLSIVEKSRTPGDIVDGMSAGQQAEKTIEIYDSISMNVNPKRIKSWIAAEEVDVGKTFNGNPHYVDHDGTIYISSTEQVKILKELSKEITKRYQDPYVRMNDSLEMLKPGDCVIVLYKDHAYYRGEIMRRSEKNPSQYLVRYVDYGTKAFVNRHSIFLNVIGENIPLQVNRFVLRNSMPCSGNEWDQEALDKIHAIIVDKECSIKVLEKTRYDEVKGVEIELLEEFDGNYGIDVEELFMSRGIVRYRLEDEDWPIPLVKSVYTFEHGGFNACDQIILKLLKDREEVPPVVKMDEEAPPKLVEEFIDAKHQDTHNFVRKKVSFCQSAPKCYSSSCSSSSESEEEKFNFREKKYSRTRKHVKEITNLELREYDEAEIECIFHGAVDDSMKLLYWVEPLIPEIQKHHEQIMTAINNLPDKKRRSFHKAKKSIGKYCIVPTSDDGWLRGRIERYNERREKYITVDLVDKGKHDEFEFKKIRKLDVNCMKCPRMRIIVKHEVKTYQEMSEIAEKYDSKSTGRKLKMIVKKYDEEDDTPIVEFIDVEE